MVYYVLTFFNCRVSKLDISDTYSSRELVQRYILDWVKHCTNKEQPLVYGKYVEAHKDPNVTNTSWSCTYLSIYRGPTMNIQETKKVFNLFTAVVKKPRSDSVPGP